MKHTQYGYTLAEILLTLCILAVLATTAAPSFAKISAQSQVSAAANELLSVTRHARLLALTRNTQVVFCAGNPIDGCHGNWAQREWISFLDDNRNAVLDSSDTLYTQGELAKSAHIDMAANGPFKRAILFRPLGNATWPSGAFAAGRLRICTQTAPALDLVLIGSGRTVLEKRDHSDRCDAL